MSDAIEVKEDKSMVYLLDDEGKYQEVSEKNYALSEGQKFVSFDEYRIGKYEEFGKWMKNNKDKIERFETQKQFKIKLDNFIGNVKEFHKTNPFFYDKQNIFWFWDINKFAWEVVDEVDLMNKLDQILGLDGQTVSSRIKSCYLEAFKRVGRNKIPKEAKVKWVQFKDKAYSISSNCFYDIQPNYFFTNPIPHIVSDNPETPVMDKLFEEWVGVEYMDLLYEIIAYSTYRAYPLQVLFSLVGNGRNGKSCFLRLLSRFIGQSNVCSTELDLLVGHTSSRFESFKLYKKLVCLMGETNFGTLTQSSLLKKLTGGDMIGFEMKGKKPFDDYNYAKMIIASNSLPSSDDTSDGFYRRWIIVDFPNQFPEGKDILDTVPIEEYSNLAKKVTLILPKLLKRGSFLGQEDISKRKDKYIMASNPITMFIDACCIKDDNSFVSYGELYLAYVQYLKKHKKRRVLRKEFKIALEDEGIFVDRCSKKIDEVNDGWKSSMWVEGLILKGGWKSDM